MTRNTSALATSAAALIGLAALAITSRPVGGAPAIPRRLSARAPTINPRAAVRAARRMNRAAGVIAASVLADSAIEHYRGSFHNKAMAAPLVTAALSLAVSAHGNADKRPAARHQFVLLEGLQQKIVGAEIQRLDLDGECVPGGQYQYRLGCTAAEQTAH